MAVSTLDGVIEAAAVKRRLPKVTVFQEIVVRRASGPPETLRKVVVENALAEHLVPGMKGRLYLFRVIDMNGIHGLRDDRGNAWFGLVKGNETAMLICAGFGAAAVLLSLLLRTWLTSWAVICLILGMPCYLIYRATRLAAERQFAADADFRPTASPGT